ncbi:hypothetical protein AAKU55_001159 [Oxalobacteraceae bacterium GrIS 1.11]
MAIPVSLPVTSGADGTKPAADKLKASDAAEPSPAAKARLQLNASIVQASLSVSISSQDQPMALLLKTALTSINEALKSQFGENAIENAVSQDNTPQGTASRIVALSTGFFDAFKQQHPGEDENAVLQKFMDTIKGGADTGFKEARNILQGLNVLGGDIAGNIDQTYALVQKGYADFQAAHMAAAPVTAPVATPVASG